MRSARHLQDADFHWNVWEEMPDEPVTLREVVGEFPGTLLLIGFLVVVGILIYGAGE